MAQELGVVPWSGVLLPKGHRYFTLEEAAHATSLPPKRIKHAIKTGRLKAKVFDVGYKGYHIWKFKILEDDLLDFLDRSYIWAIRYLRNSES